MSKISALSPLCLIGLLCVACGTPPPEISIDKKILVSCLKPGRELGLGSHISLPNEQDRMPAELGLYLVEGNRMTRLNSLAELEGNVTVETPSDALEIVRLRTGPDTFRLWDGCRLAEIHDPRKVDVKFYAGNQEEFVKNAAGVDTDGVFGSVFSSSACGAISKYPKVTKDSKGFLVKRLLIGTGSGFPEPAESLSVRAVLERVTFNGNWWQIDNSPYRDPVLDKVSWRIPGDY